MISQEDLPGLLETTIPELSGICKKKKCRNAYDVVRQMLLYTHIKVVKHNITAAKDCLRLAEQLYKKGNTAIRCAIENVFVYSFTRAFFRDERVGIEMSKILPVTLMDLYKNQVVNSHL